MNRQELLDIVNGECDSVQKLFVEKNKSYGNKHDGFHNFRETARRVLGEDSPDNMFTVLLIYMDKHLVALTNNGIGEKEFRERYRDIIVYSLIAVAMRSEYEIDKQLIAKYESIRDSVGMMGRQGDTTTQIKTKKR